jgi:hypothetical protein
MRDKLAFDADDEMRAGAIVTSLLLEYPEVWVRRSSSRRGYHIVVDAPHDLMKRFELYDCRGRLMADLKRRARGLPVNILFYWKNSKFTSKWVRVKPLEVSEDG